MTENSTIKDLLHQESSAEERCNACGGAFIRRAGELMDISMLLT